MTARTGLGPLEVALLDALDLLGAVPGSDRVPCAEVLAVVEQRDAIGVRYAWPALVDLGVPWRLHLPLIEPFGNVGSQRGSDTPAEPRYVEARLSPVGALALAAERGEVGPVPLGLVEGSLYRDGPVPPFASAAVVSALLAGHDDAGPPVLPTGGTVHGDVAGLLAGRGVRLTLGCTIRPEAGRLVVTEVPLGVDPDLVVSGIAQRATSWEREPGGRGHRRVRAAGCPVLDVADESTARDGMRLVVTVDPHRDLVDARDWLRDVWPVTVEVDCRLPAPQSERLTGWERGDGSGLRALADLLAGRPG